MRRKKDYTKTRTTLYFGKLLKMCSLKRALGGTINKLRID